MGGNRRRYFLFYLQVLLISFGFIFTLSGKVSAVYEEDPVKATKSGTVAVTKELLAQDGQTGPASPTRKVYDTAKFLVKKPYQGVHDETEDDSAKASKPWWKRWFFWFQDWD